MKNSDEPAFGFTKMQQGTACNSDVFLDLRPNTFPSLTKREYIAIEAMKGLISGITKFSDKKGMEDIIENRPADVAELACLYADVLLIELDK